MFVDCTHDEDKTDGYHGREGFSVSQWKLLPGDPESFYGYHVAEPPLWQFETTPAMEFGTMVHARLLEPDTFAERFPEGKPCCGVLKSGKNAGSPCGNAAAYRTASDDWYCGVHAKGTTAEPCQSLSADDALRLNSIVHSCYGDPKIRWCLEAPGEVEYALFGEHEETGLFVRGRLDKWIETPDGRFIVDIKTVSCDPTNERLAAAQFLARGYHLQAAAYLDMMAAHGKPCDAFLFVAIKTAPPYTACLWSLNENDVDLGRRINRLALRDIETRLASGNWNNDRHGRINYMAFPAYAHEGNTHIDSLDPYEEFTPYAE